MTDNVAELFRQVAANMAAVAESEYPQFVARAADLVHDAFASGRKLLVFGNGGS
jgi:phosphoheptose isomerase